MKTYIKPTTNILAIAPTTILAGSDIPVDSENGADASESFANRRYNILNDEE